MASGLIALINIGNRSVVSVPAVMPAEADALTSKSDSRLRYHASRARPAATLCVRTWYSVEIFQLAPTVTLAAWFTESAGKGLGRVAVASGFVNASRFAVPENFSRPLPETVTTVPAGSASRSSAEAGITNSPIEILSASSTVGPSSPAGKGRQDSTPMPVPAVMPNPSCCAPAFTLAWKPSDT